MPKDSRFDPEHPVPYPLYECPVCDSAFYGGGQALHNKGCTETGYKNVTVVFGPKCVEQIHKSAERGDSEWNGIPINKLLDQAVVAMVERKLKRKRK